MVVIVGFPLLQESSLPPSPEASYISEPTRTPGAVPTLPHFFIVAFCLYLADSPAVLSVFKEIKRFNAIWSDNPGSSPYFKARDFNHICKLPFAVESVIFTGYGDQGTDSS